MIRNYFKTSFRHLWKNRTTTAINLFGLSIGMTAAVFIFLWVKNEMNYDDYHADRNNTYLITNLVPFGDRVSRWEGSPMLMGKFAMQEVPEIKRVARFVTNTWDPPKIRVDGKIFAEKSTAYMDSCWFDLFRYEFVEGNAEVFKQNPFSVVLTQSKAKKYFGEGTAIGKVIQVDTVNYTVAAVVKDNPLNSSFQYDVMMQINGYLSDPATLKNDRSWTNFGYISFLQLRPDADRKKIEARLNAILDKNKKDNKVHVMLEPLASMYFANDLEFSQLPHGNKKTVYIFSVLALLILLTACINYINLTTARASLRSKEVSVRKIVGAGRWNLFSQFIAESFSVSLLSIALTLVILKIALPGFNLVAEKKFLLPLMSPGLWEILLVTLFFAALVNGIYPALLLSRFNPLQVFRGKNILKLSDGSVRKVLVVFQFALSTILIIGTIVIFKQLNYIQHTNPGYNVSQVISVTIPQSATRMLKDEQKTGLFSSVELDLKMSSAIQDVCIGGSPIVNVQSASSGNADWDGRDTAFNPTIARLSADENFQKLFQLQVKEGRWFRSGKEDDHNYIINETAERELGLHKPVIGQRFIWGGDTGMVVGVVKDFHYRSLHDRIGPMVLMTNQSNGPCIFIKAYPGNARQAVQAVEKTWRKFIPDEPFEFTFLDDSFSSLYKADIQTSRLIFIFSLIAILISGLGLFGLAAFMAERRTKEIGIRKVLGASVQQITSLLSKDFLRLVLVALFVATPIAWWMLNNWLQEFAYRIRLSPWIFIGAGVIAIVIALISVGYQSVKAAVASPVESIRTE